jgi:intein/homing endonuclease
MVGGSIMLEKIPAKIKSEIIKLHEDGIGTTKTSEMLNVSPSTIQKYLKKNNLKPLGINRPYKNKYNTHFFSEYTKESVYWAGFIMADGCISDTNTTHNVQIMLSIKDKSHLQKLSEIINFTGPLYEYKKNNSITIRMSGKKIINDLFNKYGITKKKSLIAEFPKQLPRELYSHFIRGYFDGDGSIYKGSSPTISFIGNENIVKSIRDILHETLELEIKSSNDKPPLRNTGSEKIKQFAYCGKNTKKIIKWLYNKTNENIRLDRKYKKCMEYL